MKYVLPLCLLLVACSKPLASSDFYGAMPELELVSTVPYNPIPDHALVESSTFRFPGSLDFGILYVYKTDKDATAWYSKLASMPGKWILHKNLVVNIPPIANEDRAANLEEALRTRL